MRFVGCGKLLITWVSFTSVRTLRTRAMYKRKAGPSLETRQETSLAAGLCLPLSTWEKRVGGRLRERNTIHLPFVVGLWKIKSAAGCSCNKSLPDSLNRHSPCASLNPTYKISLRLRENCTGHLLASAACVGEGTGGRHLAALHRHLHPTILTWGDDVRAPASKWVARRQAGSSHTAPSGGHQFCLLKHVGQCELSPAPERRPPRGLLTAAVPSFTQSSTLREEFKSTSIRLSVSAAPSHTHRVTRVVSTRWDGNSQNPSCL